MPVTASNPHPGNTFSQPTNLVRRKTPITPSDTDELAEVSDGLLVGAAGNVNCILEGDASAGVIALPAGIHPLRVKKVLSTSTSATGLVALYCHL